MQAGVIPKSGLQGRHSRFAHLLSFETIYRNSQHIEKFEHKFLKSEAAKKTMQVASVKSQINDLDETNCRLFDTIKSHVKANKKLEEGIREMEMQQLEYK
jgi:hypothetical protein